MGFGSLVRSLSNSSRSSERRSRPQQSRTTSSRRHSYIPESNGAPPRSRGISSRHRNHDPVHHQQPVLDPNAAAAAFYRAKEVYEAEETQIMRDELRRRSRNDLECKRHMEMLEKQKRAEKKKLDEMLLYSTNVAIANYRAGKINSRELEKLRQKDKHSTDVKWTNFVKWYRSEQERAQRIFFTRGEEIGVSTGAALRQAREKMERSQMIAMK